MWNSRGMVAAAALLLAACGGSSDDQETASPSFETRAADAPRAEAEAPARFDFLRYTVEVDGDTPRACLVFTRPLDPEADYSGYVAVEPERQIAVEAQGRTLCIGGLSFGEGQTITLREGLPEAEGDGLRDEEVLTLEFGDRPSYVGVVGDGVILPRLEADGLGIETVNVETVDIKLWRINDRALAFRSITSGLTAAEGEYGWLGGEENPYSVGEVIWEGEMDTAGPANAPVRTVFPIAEAVGDLRPGAYFIEIDDAAEEEDDYRRPARAKRWLVITDLAITAYRGADGLDFTVRSLQSAQPVENVRVELIARSNEVLAAEETGSEGRARFEAPLTRGTGAMTPRLIAAYGPDNDFALIDLNRSPVDLTGQDVGGRSMPDGADAYVYLDRGIYRPGEQVRATALLRDVAGMAVSDRPGTLTIYGPNGIETLEHRFEAAEAAGAIFLDYELPRAAARGEWRLAARLDGHGQVGETRFTVEDFVPQRIALDLETDDETPLLGGESRAVEADIRFLYGAPGAGLPVESRLRVERDPRGIEGFDGFRWGRHDETFREIRRDLPEAVADGAGQAVLQIDPGSAGRASTLPLRLRAVISAIEPGGRAVSDDVFIPYRPREGYLGVKPAFEGRARRNAPIAFDLAAATPQGEGREAAVDWRIVRIDYEYDWYRTDNGAWRWRRSRNVVEIEEGRENLAADGSTRIQVEGLDWGDYQLVLEGADVDAEASYGFWVGWGSRPTGGVEAPDRVRISGPDDPVAVGDEAQLTILPPYPGVAEVVIASDRVLETRTLDIPEEGAEIAFRVTEDWGAGTYVMVNVFTPRDPVDRPRPRRAVGVRHLPVDMGARTFEIAFDAPEVTRPDQMLDIQVTAGDGPRREQVWLTLAAVDEGILALTRFQSPDPEDWYFGQYRLGVSLLDDYGRLLDPNQGAAAPIRQGGDSIGGAGLSVVPTRTVALFSGPVELDRDGRAQIPFDLPPFNGELRLMAVAWSESGLGSYAQPMTVREPVPAEVILPRFLAPGDTAQATVTLDNVEGAPGEYVARVSAAGAVDADASVTAQLASGERSDQTLSLTGEDQGIAGIALAVSGPDGFEATRTYPIQVRSGFLPYSIIERGRLEPGESWTPDPAAITSFTPGSAELDISFSSTPLDEGALLRSLSRYPYGCTEQITSRAMPMLYSDRIADPEGVDGIEDARLKVQESISTLLARQSNDGAIGLWRIGDRNARPWIGVYAVDFLARAKEAGYVVPDAALERAYAVLEFVAARELWRASGYDDDIYRWSRQTDTTDRLADRSAAYALYVLARAGRADRSRLRYMHDERLQAMENPLARAHLGAALALMGDRARSVSAFDAAEEALGFENPGNYYQTARRDLAGVLALAAEAGEIERVERLTERVSADLPEPNRLTTQEKAFLLLAANALSGEGESMEVEADGLVAPGGSGTSFAVGATGLGEGVSFANTGDTPVWLTQIARGAPASPPPAVAEGVRLTKRVSTLDGGQVDLDEVRQGDRLIIQLTALPASERHVPAIIEDMLPAGFEIETILRPEDAGTRGAYAWLGDLSDARIAEARDDRFVAAVDLRRRRSARLAYIVRAVTPGDFVLPGASMEDMYRPDVFARTRSDRVSIAAQ
jgi:uncharacterized protein YfaS (alpha-2-macroglobulin family)